MIACQFVMFVCEVSQVTHYYAFLQKSFYVIDTPIKRYDALTIRWQVYCMD